ncbi:MAG: helix-turn-helix domain-containing protein [Candidatus Gracilibacteria bacterium]|jgi:excisionase family DNA binding protein
MDFIARAKEKFKDRDAVPGMITTKNAAKLLGISRVAVFQKIKSGEIPAGKLCGNYVIKSSNLPNIYAPLMLNEKAHINGFVNRVIKEYGETLKLLKNS